MSISNYAELQTAVASWLHRGDLTSIIPDFITLAEAKLNRRLRLRAMEATATGSVASSISLPTGYLEARAVTVTTGTYTYPLTYTPPDTLNSDNGAPKRYSILGDNLYFLPYSSSYTYSLSYYAKFAALSAGVNWLITNAPDVYLYATLMESAPYLDDASKIQVWGQQLEMAIASIEKSDRTDRYGTNLVVRAA